LPALRIVGWNANRTFQRKLSPLLALNPDVVVISECERDVVVPNGASFAWVGDNPRMGLERWGSAHFSVDRRRRPAPAVGRAHRRPRPAVHLIAVWAYAWATSSSQRPRMSQVQRALRVYRAFEVMPAVFAATSAPT
jgi:hypothetical protein